MLTHRDVRIVGEVLDRCYHAPDVDTYAREVLAGIARLVPSAHSSFNLWDRRRSRLTWVEHPEQTDRFRGAEEVLAAHFAEHPVVRHFLARTGPPGFAKISDFMSAREFARTAIFNEYYRKRGIRHQLSIMFPGAPGPRIAIALNRDREDFRERDRTVLDLLAPHLSHGYRNAAAFAEVSGALALLERGLDVANVGLLVLGPGGTLQLASSGASRLLDAYFGKRRSNGLPDALRRWLEAGDSTLSASPFLASNGAQRLSIRVRRDGERCVLLLEVHEDGAPTQCLVQLGLSSRQAEVLRWVAAGKSDAEVATILRLSAHTVRHHLEQVYKKLGVENRTAAARLAFEAAGAGPP